MLLLPSMSRTNFTAWIAAVLITVVQGTMNSRRIFTYRYGMQLVNFQILPNFQYKQPVLTAKKPVIQKTNKTATETKPTYPDK
jgi:hypothetical protein